MSKTERHIAVLREVMRDLIAGGDAAMKNLKRRREFFSCRLHPWAPQMCETIVGHPKARFYCALAAFTQTFFSIEAQGFDMLD